MIILVESSESIEIGDIVILDTRKVNFKNQFAKDLVDTHHQFLVVDNNPIVVCPLSSKLNKVVPRFPRNIMIRDWKSAGLKRPSYVGTDTSGKIDEDDIYRVIGKATDSDLENILIGYASGGRRRTIENIVG